MHASAFFTQFGAKALPLPDPADACAPRMIDGGELVCCGYGHTKQKKKGYQRKKCYKAYHVECLGILPQHASSIPDDWFCPRHFCVQCKHWKPNSVPEPGPPPQLFSCAT
eukprot:gene11815-13947_t